MDSITSELRAGGIYRSPSNRRVFTEEELTAIADRIDAEVEQLREREYQNGREDAGGAVEFADRLCRASERREDVTLWGVDYVALPVDADGVPIHVGDVMDNTHKDGFRAKHVTGIAYHENWHTTIEVDEDRLRWHNADKLRHHHAPTVEDVLREMLDALDIDRCDDPDGTIAEYAAKLTLRGDE